MSKTSTKRKPTSQNDKDFSYDEQEKLNPKDFEISEAEESPTKKGKLNNMEAATKPKPGRKAQSEKYIFNDRDITAIERHIIQGSSPAAICRELFSECEPLVTRADVNNFISRNKKLRELCKSTHKAKKNELKNDFNKSIVKLKKDLLTKEAEEVAESDENDSENLDQNSGPSIKPYYYEDRFIAFYYRLNLLQDARLDIDEETRLLTLEISNHPSLTESEMKNTLLHKKLKEFNVFKQNEDDTTSLFHYTIPEKARLDTIERNDFDSEFGWVVEILFEKRQAIDKTKLRGKAMSHVQLTVKTSVALANTNNDQQSNDDQ